MLLEADSRVRSISSSAGLGVNAGFMVFRAGIFDYRRPGEELVEQPYQRLLAADELMAYRYQSFRATTDTQKDKVLLYHTKLIHIGTTQKTAVIASLSSK